MSTEKLPIVSGVWYNIINVAHPDFVVGLVDENGDGIIAAGKMQSDIWSWKQVQPILQPTGGSDYVFKTNIMSNHYIFAYKYLDGTVLTSDPSLATWALTPITKDVYQIRSKDGQFVWTLSKGCDYYPVTLKPAREVEDLGEAAQWKFVRVNN